MSNVKSITTFTPSKLTLEDIKRGFDFDLPNLNKIVKALNDRGFTVAVDMGEENIDLEIVTPDEASLAAHALEETPFWGFKWDGANPDSIEERTKIWFLVIPTNGEDWLIDYTDRTELMEFEGVLKELEVDSQSEQDSQPSDYMYDTYLTKGFLDVSRSYFPEIMLNTGLNESAILKKLSLYIPSLDNFWKDTSEMVDWDSFSHEVVEPTGRYVANHLVAKFEFVRPQDLKEALEYLLEKLERKMKSEIRNWLVTIGESRGLDLSQCEIEPRGDKFVLNVDGDVSLSCMGLTEIPVPFGVVSGEFSVRRNDLTSLKNAPEYCEHLICSANKLTSLKGCPEKVSMLTCYDNPDLLDIKDAMHLDSTGLKEFAIHGEVFKSVSDAQEAINNGLMDVENQSDLGV